MSQTPNPLPACHFCQQDSLRLIPGYEQLHRVTSDCQPIAPGGQLAICGKCAAVQKPLDTTWHALVKQIYSQYQIYHQSGGVEQVIFDQHTGRADTRSAALLTKLFKALPTPPAERGRLLDVGCGNGALLAAFHHQRPHWQLTGTELGDDHRERIEAIPGVEAFFAGPVQEVPGQFDLITLMHVLEHVPEPAAFLADLATKLEAQTNAHDAGEAPQPLHLFIEVPDHTRNPFDLLIADHSAHFTQQSLAWVLARAGFETVLLRNDLVPKELSAAACLRANTKSATTETSNAVDTPDSLVAPDAQAAMVRVQKRVAWLRGVLELAQKTAENGPLGVFGTSIAGTWLGASLGEKVSFYVDEDTARHGRRFMDRPVMGVNNAPAGVPVLLALPPWLAQDVAGRLAKSQINWLLPPELDED